MPAACQTSALRSKGKQAYHFSLHLKFPPSGKVAQSKGMYTQTPMSVLMHSGFVRMHVDKLIVCRGVGSEGGTSNIERAKRHVLKRTGKLCLPCSIGVQRSKVCEANFTLNTLLILLAHVRTAHYLLPLLLGQG